MSDLSRSEVGLRFFGDDLDPDVLSQKLGSLPTVGARKGETWLTSMGVPKIARRGTWRLTAEKTLPADLDGQIMSLLHALSSDETLWHELTAQYEVDLFCGLFLKVANEGIALRPETLREIGRRNIKIDFDIYYEGD